VCWIFVLSLKWRKGNVNFVIEKGVGYVCEDMYWKGRLTFRILMVGVGVLLVV